jgi:hypothetical protein
MSLSTTDVRVVPLPEAGDALSEVPRLGAPKLLAQAIEAEVADWIERHGHGLAADGDRRNRSHPGAEGGRRLLCEGGFDGGRDLGKGSARLVPAGLDHRQQGFAGAAAPRPRRPKGPLAPGHGVPQGARAGMVGRLQRLVQGGPQPGPVLRQLPAPAPRPGMAAELSARQPVLHLRADRPPIPLQHGAAARPIAAAGPVPEPRARRPQPVVAPALDYPIRAVGRRLGIPRPTGPTPWPSAYRPRQLGPVTGPDPGEPAGQAGRQRRRGLAAADGERGGPAGDKRPQPRLRPGLFRRRLVDPDVGLDRLPWALPRGGGAWGGSPLGGRDAWRGDWFSRAWSSAIFAGSARMMSGASGGGRALRSSVLSSVTPSLARKTQPPARPLSKKTHPAV